jgi:DNA-binding response OmpR family regulator
VPSQTAAVARILIVDDDASVVDAFARTLRLDGHEVWSARSAADGLSLAQVHQPHAIILDLRMPLISALGFLRRVRRFPAFAHIPVAIVTGDYQVDESRADELHALGAQLHYKPLWLGELVTLARNLLIPVRN